MILNLCKIKKQIHSGEERLIAVDNFQLLNNVNNTIAQDEQTKFYVCQKFWKQTFSIDEIFYKNLSLNDETMQAITEISYFTILKLNFKKNYK